MSILTNPTNMKVFLLITLALILVSFSTGQPPEFDFTWHIAVALIAAIYEVVARIIPTVKNYAALHKVVEILVWLSNFLNRKK